jgi:pimeloyl-ACP methyl ester carboxylesterase
MKGKWFLGVILTLTFVGCMSTNKNSFKQSERDSYVINNRIDSFEDIIIGGCQEKVSIQSDNVSDNPILIYLHGGPGSSVFMYSHLYNEKLKKAFIFVNWDQRGTAFSYHDGMTTNISEDIIRDDTLELVKYLLKRFNKEKVYLIGHSFGSAIGLHLVANHPEYFYAYIGVGQVIDYKYNESVEITYKWLHKTLDDANDAENISRIEKDHFPYIDIVTKYGGHHRLSIDLNKLKMSSPYYFDGYLDLAEKSKAFTLDSMSKNLNLKAIFNKPLSKIDIPLYFFEGVNDHVIACAPELVTEYCNNVKAPRAKTIWFQNSAHMPNIEEPEKFQDELINIKNEIENE